MFRSGMAEVVVGRSMAGRIKGMTLGGSIRFEQRDWTVVGIFETGGNGFESEVWGDMSVLQTVFADREGVFQSLTFRLADPSGFTALKKEIEKDPKYKVKLQVESQYYKDQSGMLSDMIAIMGTLITIIMAAGAMFGAMNTMYAAVGTRAREIATLRALGFGRFSILASFLFEALVLSAIGGVIGCLLVLPLNGVTTSAMNWDTFSELAFAFRVTPGLLLAGVIFALVLGLLGGLLPALRAARLPITTGLRQA
jgi:putative ABC transport system permease protein